MATKTADQSVINWRNTMKLSQRLQQLAASLVHPDKPFEPGQIVVYKSLFVEAGENTWSCLMVIMPQRPQLGREPQMHGLYGTRDGRYDLRNAYQASLDYRISVGMYHPLGNDYELMDVDPRHIRLATEDEIKRGDALAYEQALEYLNVNRTPHPAGNIAWMTQKEGDPIDSWKVRPVIAESTWAGGGVEFGAQLGENRSEIRLSTGAEGYYEEQRQRRNQRGLEAYDASPVTVGAKVSSAHGDQRCSISNRPMHYDEFVLYAHAVASGLFDITDVTQVSMDRMILIHSEMPEHVDETVMKHGVAAKWAQALWLGNGRIEVQRLMLDQWWTLPTEVNKALVIKYLHDDRIVGTLYIRSPSIQPGEKEPLSEAVKPLGIDDGVDVYPVGTYDWEGFNDRFAHATTVKEELAIATEYAVELLRTPLIHFPVEHEIHRLGGRLVVVNDRSYADETYVVVIQTDQVVAKLLAEDVTSKQCDVLISSDVNDVVIINVKDSRVISVNIYSK